MRFEWDDDKNAENRNKHRISFEVAIEVFQDPLHLAILDRVTDDEERWWAVGCLENLTVVVVVHTFGSHGSEEVIRIISARKASPREQAWYEENQQFDI